MAFEIIHFRPVAVRAGAPASGGVAATVLPFTPPPPKLAPTDAALLRLVDLCIARAVPGSANRAQGVALRERFVANAAERARRLFGRAPA